MASTDRSNRDKPQAWKAKPNKLHQKDRDARWVKKNKTNFYGYKTNIKVDHGTKLIGAYAVSAYIGREESIDWCGLQSEVHEKSARTKKLKKSQKNSNKRKSKYRARGEHVFRFLTKTMHAGYPHYRHYQSSTNLTVQYDALWQCI